MRAKTIRTTLNISQAEMAALMGVHKQTWIKWERDERRMSDAAATLGNLLVFLHERAPDVLNAWRKSEKTLDKTLPNG